MEEGEPSEEAADLLDGMRGAVGAFEPTTEGQAVLYDNEIERLHELADARRARLLYADGGLPGVLWAVLLVGAVIEVGFTYLFGLRSATVHVLMVAALALIVGLVLFTVGALDYPFRGGARVGPGAFEEVLNRMEQSKLSDLR
jgi:hypothetical protein